MRWGNGAQSRDAVGETAAGVGRSALPMAGGDWTCSVVVSVSGTEGLVRLRGKRRWRRFAGTIGAPSVAFRGTGCCPGRGNHSIKRHILSTSAAS